jgi:hypothetical protein
MVPILIGAVTLAMAVLVGCSDDSSSGKPSSPDATAGAAGDATSQGGSGQVVAPDRCSEGCVATLAAACSNGPSDQASCESTCHALEAGACGAEYAAFQDCAEGKAVTCGPSGIPVVEECSDAQTAFIACINR